MFISFRLSLNTISSYVYIISIFISYLYNNANIIYIYSNIYIYMYILISNYILIYATLSIFISCFFPIV